MNSPQDRLALVWGEIENTTIALGIPGLVGAEQPPEADRIVVHWHGPVDPRITALIDASGCAVEIRQVPFAPDALLGAARTAAGLPSVVSAGLGRDFRSLHVRVRRGTLGTATPAVEGAVAGFGPIPVTFEESDGGTRALTYR